MMPAFKVAAFQILHIDRYWHMLEANLNEEQLKRNSSIIESDKWRCCAQQRHQKISQK